MRSSSLPLIMMLLLVSVSSVLAGTKDPRISFLERQRSRGKLNELASLPVSVRFRQTPQASDLRALESLGVELITVKPNRIDAGVHRFDDRWVLGTATIVPARAPWPALEALLALPQVERVETSWSPTRSLPLYQTRAMSGAEDAWTIDDGVGQPLRGAGVVICDIDSGIDHFHPDFWVQDGPIYDWIDADSSGGWSVGDAVDLDGSGSADAGEDLQWLDAPGGAPGMSTSLQVPIDHFFHDANGNGVRDFGAGFVEADPTHGEAILRVVGDTNGVLDPGESLQALGSPKVLGVYQTDGLTRTAGVDLILNEGDTIGHGTQVSSIHVGGEPGRRFAGLAPDARLLHGNILYGEDFVLTPMEDRMAWGASQGADIIVHEIGGWVWEYLDGSSNVETMIDQLAAAGIVQVVAAGNLATGGMHWEDDLGDTVGDSLVTDLVSVSPASPITEIFGDFYYVPASGDEVEVELTTPAGATLALLGDGGTDTVGDYDVYHLRSTSSRGTERLDWQISFSAGSALTELDGTWSFTLRRASVAAVGPSPLRIYAMVSDDVSGWFGNSTWTDATNQNTVTWPATADEAIRVAAYEPNSGALNSFSGRGVRVDGLPLVDLAAPGSLTYSGYRNQDRSGVAGGYGAFGGTSAATPHVAAAAAILLQWEPTADPDRIRELLQLGAVEDAATGVTPNTSWGYGKLQVHDSIVNARTDVPGLEVGSALSLGPNAPNPFNPSTRVRYSLSRDGDVVVRIFDLRGRVVQTLLRGPQPAGEHELQWAGTDEGGQAVASGVYLVQVELDGERAARKIALVK